MTGNEKAGVLASTLDQATVKFLENKKSPSRKVRELDNRGSHFYLAMYWAEALVTQNENENLRKEFQPLAQALQEQEATIIKELNDAQGSPMDIGGYYHQNSAKTSAAMRPSTTLNSLIDG